MWPQTPSAFPKVQVSSRQFRLVNSSLYYISVVNRIEICCRISRFIIYSKKNQLWRESDAKVRTKWKAERPKKSPTFFVPNFQIDSSLVVRPRNLPLFEQVNLFSRTSPSRKESFNFEPSNRAENLSVLKKNNSACPREEKNSLEISSWGINFRRWRDTLSQGRRQKKKTEKLAT